MLFGGKGLVTGKVCQNFSIPGIDIADLTVWLWHILLFGESKEAYNVGSEGGLTIRQIAEKVRDLLAPGLKVRVFGKPRPDQLASFYVPSTKKARTELGASLEVSLEDSIRRTAAGAVKDKS